MKEPAYKGKEPLPLSVYVSARAGDPQAVERLLRYLSLIHISEPTRP